MSYLSSLRLKGTLVNYHRTRYVGGPKLGTPTTAERTDALKARLSQLRGPEPKHDDIANPYDFDDSERYDR